MKSKRYMFGHKKGLQQVFHSFSPKDFPPKLELHSWGGEKKEKQEYHTCSKHRVRFSLLLAYFIHTYLHRDIYISIHREKLSDESIFSLIFIYVNKIMPTTASSNNQVLTATLTNQICTYLSTSTLLAINIP